MQPNPMAETSRLLFPSLRFCIIFFLCFNSRDRLVLCPGGSEFAEPVSRRDSAIQKEVAASNERAFRAHEQCADSSDFVRCSGSSCCADINHAPVAFAARPV